MSSFGFVAGAAMAYLMLVNQLPFYVAPLLALILLLVAYGWRRKQDGPYEPS